MSLPSHESQAVDPTPPEDAAAIKHAATQAFVEWARRLPVAPSSPTDFIRSVEPKVRRACRLYTTITERTVVWKEEAARGSPPITGLRRKADSVDPWAETRTSLRENSLSILACSPCGGLGSLPCSRCSGTGAVRCSNCNGTRKAYGYASNGSRRLMNCRSCDARGSVSCSGCNSGRVSCSPCLGHGREQRWLEFVESVRFDFLVMTEDETLRGLPWTTVEMEKDAKLLGEISANGALSREKVAPHLPEDWLQEHWEKTRIALKTQERITSQLFQVFEAPAAQVSYSIEDARPTTVHFEGQRMLAPPVSADRQFAARARKVFAARFVLLLLAGWISLLYILRGSYFWNGWLVALCVSLGGLAILGEHFVRDWTLGRKQKARRWGIGAAVFTVLAGVMALASEPWLSSAKSHIAEGRLDDADKELLALGGPDDPSLQQAWTDLHLAHALRAETVKEVAEDAVLMKAGSPQRAKVDQHLLELTRQQVLQSLARKEPASALEVLTTAKPALEQSFSKDVGELTARIHETEFETCSTEACQWKALGAALRAEPTSNREQRQEQVRATLIERLSPTPRPKVATLEWVLYLDKTRSLATELGETPSDADLGERARQAATWTQEERGRISLIGAERAVATALLQLSSGGDSNILMATTKSVSLYCALKDGRCAGAYLVGADKASRALNGLQHAVTTKELFSRALGHSAELPAPPQPRGGKSPTQSTWKDGGVTIVARWSGAHLMELRIGEVKP
ncbi:hypothetical protein ACN469_04445 [Corallococcus terminator]